MVVSQTDVLRRRVGTGLRAQICRFVAPTEGLVGRTSGSNRALLRGQAPTVSRDVLMYPSHRFIVPGNKLLSLLAGKRVVRVQGTSAVDPASRAPDNSDGGDGDSDPFMEEMREASATPLTEPPVVSERLHLLESDAEGSDAPSPTYEPMVPTTESSNGTGQLSNGQMGTSVGEQELRQMAAPVAAPSPGVTLQKDKEDEFVEDEEGVWLPHRWKVCCLVALI